MQGEFLDRFRVSIEELELQAIREENLVREYLKTHISRFSISQISDVLGVNKTRLYNWLNNKPNNALRFKELCILNCFVKKLTNAC